MWVPGWNRYCHPPPKCTIFTSKLQLVLKLIPGRQLISHLLPEILSAIRGWHLWKYAEIRWSITLCNLLDWIFIFIIASNPEPLQKNQFLFSFRIRDHRDNEESKVPPWFFFCLTYYITLSCLSFSLWLLHSLIISKYRHNCSLCIHTFLVLNTWANMVLLIWD